MRSSASGFGSRRPAPVRLGAFPPKPSPVEARVFLQGTRLYELLGWGTERGVALGRLWLGEEHVEIALSPGFSPSTLASHRRKIDRRR